VEVEVWVGLIKLSVELRHTRLRVDLVVDLRSFERYSHVDSVFLGLAPVFFLLLRLGVFVLLLSQLKLSSDFLLDFPLLLCLLLDLVLLGSLCLSDAFKDGDFLFKFANRPLWRVQIPLRQVDILRLKIGHLASVLRSVCIRF
jgi:hypothetical protein